MDNTQFNTLKMLGIVNSDKYMVILTKPFVFEFLLDEVSLYGDILKIIAPNLELTL